MHIDTICRKVAFVILDATIIQANNLLLILYM